jgi:hypothetical protein
MTKDQRLLNSRNIALLNDQETEESYKKLGLHEAEL